jgi:hypothetical protein
MKNTLFFIIISFSTSVYSNYLHAQAKQDTFYPRKYAHIVEIDMKGLFSYFGPGGGMIFRKRHETGNFVFVDRTRFWRFGLYMYGNGFQRRIDSVGIGWFNNTNPPNFYFNPIFGHETMFHFKKFNLFYAYDFGLNYAYLDDFYERSHRIALSISASLGMRYFLNNRLSLSLQSTPLSLSVFRRFGKLRNGYTQLPIRNDRGDMYYITVFQSEPFTFRENGFSIGQSWFSSLGFSYHF